MSLLGTVGKRNDIILVSRVSLRFEVFESITEPISKSIRHICEAISRFRLRLRYYASTVLFVSGVVYWVLGFGLFVASFFAMPMSLLALIPAIFLFGLGKVYMEGGTCCNWDALLWCVLPALVMFFMGIDMLCNDSLTQDGRMVVSMEVVVLGIIACPGLFVLTHGHSLFGPKALTHKQLKEKYQNVIVRHIAESTHSVNCEKRIKSEDDLTALVKFGSIVFAGVFILINILVITDEIKEPVCKGSAKYCGSENQCPSNVTEEDNGSEVESTVNNNLMVLMCSHVAEGKAKPTCVFQTPPVSEADSGWQCLCSQEQHDPSDARFIGMNEAIQRCPQLKEIIKKSH